MDIPNDWKTGVKAVVADFLAAFSRGDVEAVVNRMTEDATWWVSGTIQGMSGTYARLELATLLEGVKQVYKQGALQIAPLSMIAEGDKVAVEAEFLRNCRTGGSTRIASIIFCSGCAMARSLRSANIWTPCTPRTSFFRLTTIAWLARRAEAAACRAQARSGQAYPRSRFR